MELNERRQAETVLRRIPSQAWGRFFESEDGRDLAEQVEVTRKTMLAAGLARGGAPGKPVEPVLDLLGDRLLSHPKFGRHLRKMLLEAMPQTKWNKLLDRYRAEAGVRADRVHGNSSQRGAGSKLMAEYWHQGGNWARSFCDLVGLPDCLAEQRANVLPDDEEIASVRPLPPLHDFQLDVYRKLRRLLADGTGASAMLSLPTGAGKTRVAVEAIVDHLAVNGGRRNVVVWIAQSDELQRQAWECFREVWQTPPERPNGAEPIPRTGLLRIVRAWGSRRADEIDLGSERTVLIAGIQQLASWVNTSPDFFDDFPLSRVAAVVVDEAHRIITAKHREVLRALRIRAAHRWETLPWSPPVIGLTATPWRTVEKEDAPLRSYFKQQLLTPQALGSSPIAELQRRKILARAEVKRLIIHDSPKMSAIQRARYDQFHELPNDYLKTLGRAPGRNGTIVARLLRLERKSRVLVFACSVEHAAVLTLALNQAAGEKVAALVTGKTPRSERYDVLEAFRAGKLRFLCNVGVLTTGFDAPMVDVVCLTRPTGSALHYEQMVGRGLRGPKNGGTTRCLVLDVQDEGLPDSIMSYARVVKEWTEDRRRARTTNGA